MITEAELVEIAIRADYLEEISTEVTGAIGNALLEGDDWRERLEPIDQNCTRIAVDVYRLIEECRIQRRKSA